MAVAVVAVVLLGVPLGVAGAIVRAEATQAELNRRAQQIGRLVDDYVANRRDVDALVVAPQVPDGDYAVVRVRGREPIRAGAVPDGPYLEGRYSSRTVDVFLRRHRSAVQDQVLGVVLLVLTASVIAVAAAVAVGVVASRRLASPLVDLAAAASRLGAGGSRPTFRRYGIDEVDDVAAVLQRSSDRISAILALERRFASDASHQLRTPLTALSMRLEEIAAAEDPKVVREEATVALSQVERLAGVVDHLLDRARETRSAAASQLDVDTVLRQQLEEWGPAFAGSGRALRLEGARGLTAVASPGAMAQVVATLVENSLLHGAGTVTVRTRPAAGWVVIEVADEGQGVPAALSGRVFDRAVSGAAGTGLGLGLARDLAEADGGRLELLAEAPPVFALFLASGEDGAGHRTRPAPVGQVARVPAGAPGSSVTSVSGAATTAGKTHRR